MSGTDSISDSVPNLQRLTALYTFLHVAGGLVGLPIIIATVVLSRHASRHPTMINLFISLFIYSLSYLLLIFGRQQEEQFDPAGKPSALCQAQQALVHGAPTMASTAGLVVVIQSLVLPYVVFVAYTVASAVLGAKYPETVNASNGLYCTILKDPFRHYAVPGYTAVALLFVIIFEVLAGIKLYKSWTSISRMFPMARRQTTIYMFTRVVVFNVYSIITLSASAIFLADALSAWPYFVQAGLPLAAVVVFGTQKDLLQAWRILSVDTKHSILSSQASLAIPSARPRDLTVISVTTETRSERV
ncbi:hypothetical protein K525DRAFT_276279 [Schizophyllum commune Loenen D]|nr:hypothetical protein K525DRAFT_276279 [Schizophyllum commune Loenen D]